MIIETSTTADHDAGYLVPSIRLEPVLRVKSGQRGGWDRVAPSENVKILTVERDRSEKQPNDHTRSGVDQNLPPADDIDVL